MVDRGNSTDPNLIPEVTAADIQKEGYLYKQSRFIKEWRKRWFVLTKSHILSFKDERVYKNPTEVILISSCSTVKSVEEEINKPNAFKLEVNGRTYYMQAENYADKESWIGALGKAMIKKSVLIDDEDEDAYM
eukprot:403334236